MIRWRERWRDQEVKKKRKKARGLEGRVAGGFQMKGTLRDGVEEVERAQA